MDMNQLANDPHAFYRALERTAMDRAICDLVEGGMSPGQAAETVEQNMWDAQLNPPYNWADEPND